MKAEPKRILLEKQPEKYLRRAPENIRKRLYAALEQVALFQGDIVKLAGKENLYRYKIPKYRIIFRYENGVVEIVVIEINTRTNIKYREV